MFANESTKTWLALGLLGVSAATTLALTLPHHSNRISLWQHSANLLTAAAVFLCLYRRHESLNRSMSKIHDDVKAGRRKLLSPLQLICIVIAIALNAVQVYRSLH